MCSSFPGLLIGRTAVHSGKDPAFVAYDQFLSTGILQPLSRGEVRCGSKPVKLGTSKCFQVCPRKRTYLPISELLPPPALGERRHRGLARRLVAVGRATYLLRGHARPPPFDRFIDCTQPPVFDPLEAYLSRYKAVFRDALLEPQQRRRVPYRRLYLAGSP